MTVTLYSQYFNARLSKRLGRRVPRNVAARFSDQKLEEILRSLGYPFESKDGYYPRVPWEKTKIYIVESKVKKSTLLSFIEKRL
ncbi:MAG TPA: signal recognition particle subunit SRP19/SEC65 family protein [Thermoplasmataceae archaeon]|nr:signal recognition particle [Thermoplasmatales archaeon AK]HLH86445.1 signal recognition particle subunit SRP19/SEC65 family protein [Thermoplasmataceae archaeon]